MGKFVSGWCHSPPMLDPHCRLQWFSMLCRISAFRHTHCSLPTFLPTPHHHPTSAAARAFSGPTMPVACRTTTADGVGIAIRCCHRHLTRILRALPARRAPHSVDSRARFVVTTYLTPPVFLSFHTRARRARHSFCHYMHCTHHTYLCAPPLASYATTPTTYYTFSG